MGCWEGVGVSWDLKSILSQFPRSVFVLGWFFLASKSSFTFVFSRTSNKQGTADVFALILIMVAFIYLHVEIRVQILRVSPLLLPFEFQDWNSITRLGGSASTYWGISHPPCYCFEMLIFTGICYIQFFMSASAYPSPEKKVYFRPFFCLLLRSTLDRWGAVQSNTHNFFCFLRT